MKNKRRLISLLLAILVLTGIAITAVSADGAVKITNIGSNGNLGGIPTVVPAENITYLSDIYNTAAKVYSYVVPGGNGAVRDFALDQNFFGTRVYPFTGPSDSNRYAVTKGASNLDAEGYRTLNNGVKVHYSDIVLGRNTTIFEKGLAFQPSAKDAADQATVIFDVRALDADYFYAVAGMTGEGNKSSYQRKIDFELYGSKDTAYSENMSFEKLAYAEGICAYLMGEFNIPISGYNYIKLVAVTKVSNTAAESVWADACVYKLPTTDFSVSVNWDDTYNPTAIRPDGDIVAQLYADGVAVDGKTVTLNAGNNWSASWNDLDKYQDDLSTEIVYTVAAVEDPSLHRLVSSANGVMTYQYDATLTTKDIPVSLVWNDENASGRADQVTVQLYADGIAQTGKTIALNADNNWSGTFEDLPEKKRVSAEETTDIAYTFKVTTRVNNYVSSISDSEGSIVVTMTYSASNAQKFSNIGMSGTLDGIPAEATGSNTHYLTDMLNGRNKKVVSQYIADGGKYKSFENYDGKLQIFTGGTKQHLIENADTVVNGVTYQPTDIALGANGTVYSEGLSFEVSAPTADDTYITYNLTGMNATNFYAVAGITDATNDIMTKPFFLTFEVWGSKDGTTYEKLGYAEQLRSYLVAEFNVDITGYNYLKLTAYNTGDLNEGISAVWADALVYCASSGTTPTPPQPSEPTEPTEPEEIPGKYTASADGSYAGIKAVQDSVIYLSEATASDATKGKYITGWYVAPKSGQTESRYPSLDYPFTKPAGSAIVVGAKSTQFSHGLGVLPTSGTGTNKTHILLDISSIPDVDRFYAVAGLTGTGVDKDGNNYGVVFEVYGSEKVTTDQNDASFKKLAVSGDVFGKDSGEFDVDITGMKTLKLVTLIAESNKSKFNTNCQSIWADACVYKYDPNGTAPTDPTEPEDKLTDSGDVDTSEPIGYTASKNGSYTGITKAAKDSYVALSDAKYVGDSYILPSASNPNRTVRINTTDLNADTPSNAIIGEANAKFAKHLTLHPTEKSNTTYSFVELDLTGLDVDRFYSAVGISAPNGKTGGLGVIFNVFGYDETKADYVLIGTSSDVHGYESGEFDIDITGYKKLKLEVALTADSTDHYSRTSSWCDIAVYKYDANGSAPDVPEEEALPGVYTHSSNGSYKWISDAKNSAVTYLSKLVYKESSNSSAGNPTTKNEPYGEAGKKIIIGEKNTGFTYGLGVHPKSGSAQAYTIYDLSGLNVDRFYSAVGITNEKGKNGASKGVIFQVYADYDGNGNYKLLAESDTILKKGSGEFHVDISGAKSLKLVTLSATGDHASSASAWAAACVYKYDANGGRPTSHTTVGASNAAATKSDNTGLKHTDGFVPSSDGEYTGVNDKHFKSIIYLSDLEYLDASNTTNSANPNGQPTTLDHPYNDKASLIIIGENEQAFFKGLGVHPKNPSAPVNDSIQSWTTYDVSDLNADRFYAAVGLTNDKGKEGASKGVIFRVYADYDGNGNYKLLSHSGCLDGRETGEFDLDITGVKTLKLTVEAASSTHASSASAWANACVYDSKSVTEGVGKPVIKEPTVKPTEPIEGTEPVADDLPIEDSGKTSPVMIAGIAVICVLGLLAIVLAILLAVKNKKSRK